MSEEDVRIVVPASPLRLTLAAPALRQALVKADKIMIWYRARLRRLERELRWKESEVREMKDGYRERGLKIDKMARELSVLRKQAGGQKGE